MMIHTKENNNESQKFLDENLERLDKQCRKVLSLLKEKSLTTKYALIHHDIGHLPRRIADLIAHGYQIEKKRLKGGFINYSLKKQDS